MIILIFVQSSNMIVNINKGRTVLKANYIIRWYFHEYIEKNQLQLAPYWKNAYPCTQDENDYKFLIFAFVCLAYIYVRFCVDVNILQDHYLSFVTWNWDHDFYQIYGIEICNWLMYCYTNISIIETQIMLNQKFTSQICLSFNITS